MPLDLMAARSLGVVNTLDGVPQVSPTIAKQADSSIGLTNDTAPDVKAPDPFALIGNAGLEKYDENDAPQFRVFDTGQLFQYIGSDAFDKVGFNPTTPSDYMSAAYDFQQSNKEAAISVFSDLYTKTTSQFINHFTSYSDIFKQGAMYEDNIAFAEEEAERTLTNNRFKRLGEGNFTSLLNPFSDHFGDAWEEMAPSLGFTIGGMGATLAENALLFAGESAVTGLAGAPAAATVAAGRTIYTSSKLIKDFIKNATSIGTTLKLLKNLKSAKNIPMAAVHAFRLNNSVLAETSVEAGQNYLDFKNVKVQEFIAKNGYYPDEQELAKIKTGAHTAAKETQKYQYPILMASNLIQLRNMFFPGVAKRAATQAANKAMNLVNKGQLGVVSGFEVAEEVVKRPVLRAAGRFFGSASVEGFEEIGQAFGSAASFRKAEREYNGQESNIIDEMGYGFGKSFGSNEGWTEFVGGFATGILMSGAGKITNSIANRQVSELEDKRYAAFKYLGFGAEKAAKIERKKGLTKIAETLNSEQLLNAFKDEGLVHLLKNSATQEELSKYMEENNLFMADNLRSMSLLDFLYTGANTGKMELRLDQIKSMRDLNAKDLEDFLITQGIDKEIAAKPEAVQTIVDHILKVASNVEKHYESHRKIFAPELEKLYRDFAEAEKERLEDLKKFKEANGVDFDEEKDILPKYMRDNFVKRNEIAKKIIQTQWSQKFMTIVAADIDEDSNKASIMQSHLSSITSSTERLFSLMPASDMSNEIKSLQESIDLETDADKKTTLTEKMAKLQKIKSFRDKYFSDAELTEANVTDEGSEKLALEQSRQAAGDAPMINRRSAKEMSDAQKDIVETTVKKSSDKLKQLSFDKKENLDELAEAIFELMVAENPNDTKLVNQKIGILSGIKESLKVQRKHTTNLNLYKYITTDQEGLNDLADNYFISTRALLDRIISEHDKKTTVAAPATPVTNTPATGTTLPGAPTEQLPLLTMQQLNDAYVDMTMESLERYKILDKEKKDEINEIMTSFSAADEESSADVIMAGLQRILDILNGQEKEKPAETPGATPASPASDPIADLMKAAGVVPSAPPADPVSTEPIKPKDPAPVSGNILADLLRAQEEMNGGAPAEVIRDSVHDGIAESITELVNLPEILGSVATIVTTKDKSPESGKKVESVVTHAGIQSFRYDGSPDPVTSEDIIFFDKSEKKQKDVHVYDEESNLSQADSEFFKNEILLLLSIIDSSLTKGEITKDESDSLKKSLAKYFDVEKYNKLIADRVAKKEEEERKKKEEELEQKGELSKEQLESEIGEQPKESGEEVDSDSDLTTGQGLIPSKDESGNPLLKALEEKPKGNILDIAMDAARATSIRDEEGNNIPSDPFVRAITGNPNEFTQTAEDQELKAATVKARSLYSLSQLDPFAEIDKSARRSDEFMVVPFDNKEKKIQLPGGISVDVSDDPAFSGAFKQAIILVRKKRNSSEYEVMHQEYDAKNKSVSYNTKGKGSIVCYPVSFSLYRAEELNANRYNVMTGSTDKTLSAELISLNNDRPAETEADPGYPARIAYQVTKSLSGLAAPIIATVRFTTNGVLFRSGVKDDSLKNIPPGNLTDQKTLEDLKITNISLPIQSKNKIKPGRLLVSGNSALSEYPISFEANPPLLTNIKNKAGENMFEKFRPQIEEGLKNGFEKTDPFFKMFLQFLNPGVIRQYTENGKVFLVHSVNAYNQVTRKGSITREELKNIRSYDQLMSMEMQVSNAIFSNTFSTTEEEKNKLKEFFGLPVSDTSDSLSDTYKYILIKNFTSSAKPNKNEEFTRINQRLVVDLRQGGELLLLKNLRPANNDSKNFNTDNTIHDGTGSNPDDSITPCS